MGSERRNMRKVKHEDRGLQWRAEPRKVAPIRCCELAEARKEIRHPRNASSEGNIITRELTMRLGLEEAYVRE
ncbi:hypothetical protein NDU88_005089 [Pleurodeles waltl]|uniref:Uncharacterized protein n=1 Tax=Pleurodeles waltl TaxID=8319 RepID=A0AAV7NQF1_PLEWA|nr:hypothetical protein NDU88_005089 [Pleurodeles waltl]